jgi:trimeric autotransporter adhesin
MASDPDGAQAPAPAGASRGFWQDDEDVDACGECEEAFTLVLRRHHCRSCGLIFCHACVPFRGHAGKRVCARCWSAMNAGPAARRRRGSGTKSNGDPSLLPPRVASTAAAEPAPGPLSPLAAEAEARARGGRAARGGRPPGPAQRRPQRGRPASSSSSDDDDDDEGEGSDEDSESGGGFSSSSRDDDDDDEEDDDATEDADENDDAGDDGRRRYRRRAAQHPAPAPAPSPPPISPTAVEAVLESLMRRVRRQSEALRAARDDGAVLAAENAALRDGLDLGVGAVAKRLAAAASAAAAASDPAPAPAGPSRPLRPSGPGAAPKGSSLAHLPASRDGFPDARYGVREGHFGDIYTGFQRGRGRPGDDSYHPQCACEVEATFTDGPTGLHLAPALAYMRLLGRTLGLKDVGVPAAYAAAAGLAPPVSSASAAAGSGGGAGGAGDVGAVDAWGAPLVSAAAADDAGAAGGGGGGRVRRGSGTSSPALGVVVGNGGRAPNPAMGRDQSGGKVLRSRYGVTAGAGGPPPLPRAGGGGDAGGGGGGPGSPSPLPISSSSAASSSSSAPNFLDAASLRAAVASAQRIDYESLQALSALDPSSPLASPARPLPDLLLQAPYALAIAKLVPLPTGDPSPAQQLNASSRHPCCEWLRPGLLLTHVNGTHLAGLPPARALELFVRAQRPVALRFLYHPLAVLQVQHAALATRMQGLGAHADALAAAVATAVRTAASLALRGEGQLRVLSRAHLALRAQLGRMEEELRARTGALETARAEAKELRDRVEVMASLRPGGGGGGGSSSSKARMVSLVGSMLANKAGLKERVAAAAAAVAAASAAAAEASAAGAAAAASAAAAPLATPLSSSSTAALPSSRLGSALAAVASAAKAKEAALKAPPPGDGDDDARAAGAEADGGGEEGADDDNSGPALVATSDPLFPLVPASMSSSALYGPGRATKGGPSGRSSAAAAAAAAAAATNAATAAAAAAEAAAEAAVVAQLRELARTSTTVAAAVAAVNQAGKPSATAATSASAVPLLRARRLAGDATDAYRLVSALVQRDAALAAAEQAASRIRDAEADKAAAERREGEVRARLADEQERAAVLRGLLDAAGLPGLGGATAASQSRGGPTAAAAHGPPELTPLWSAYRGASQQLALLAAAYEKANADADAYRSRAEVLQEDCEALRARLLTRRGGGGSGSEGGGGKEEFGAGLLALAGRRATSAAAASLAASRALGSPARPAGEKGLGGIGSDPRPALRSLVLKALRTAKGGGGGGGEGEEGLASGAAAPSVADEDAVAGDENARVGGAYAASGASDVPPSPARSRTSQRGRAVLPPPLPSSASSVASSLVGIDEDAAGEEEKEEEDRVQGGVSSTASTGRARPAVVVRPSPALTAAAAPADPFGPPPDDLGGGAAFLGGGGGGVAGNPFGPPPDDLGPADLALLRRGSRDSQASSVVGINGGGGGGGAARPGNPFAGVDADADDAEGAAAEVALPARRAGGPSQSDALLSSSGGGGGKAAPLAAAALINARLAMAPTPVPPSAVAGDLYQRLLATGSAARRTALGVSGGSAGGGSAGGVEGSEGEGFVLCSYFYKCSRDPGKKSFGNWAWRFGSVGKGEVTYFKSEFDTKPQGRFALRTVASALPLTPTQAQGKPFAVEIALTFGKVFLFSFQAAEERDAWLALMGAAAALNAQAGRRKGEDIAGDDEDAGAAAGVGGEEEEGAGTGGRGLLAQRRSLSMRLKGALLRGGGGAGRARQGSVGV